MGCITIRICWARRNLNASAALLGLLMAVAGLANAQSDKALNPFAPKPTVVATIKPLALLAQSIAGDDFNVVTLLPPNANPHALAMTIADRQRLDDASLVLWLGSGFERFLEKPMQQRRGAQLELGSLEGLNWPAKSPADLHLWLDPHNIAQALKAITVELTLIEPLNRNVLDQRLASALRELAQREQAIQRELDAFKNVPFAVSHDGYAHFVGAFGLNQLAAATRLPEEQLSARRMYELQKSLAGASCLVVEPGDHSGVKLAKVLGVPAVEVDPLGRAPEITSITTLLQSLTTGFKHCFNLRNRS